MVDYNKMTYNNKFSKNCINIYIYMNYSNYFRVATTSIEPCPTTVLPLKKVTVSSSSVSWDHK